MATTLADPLFWSQKGKEVELFPWRASGFGFLPPSLVTRAHHLHPSGPSCRLISFLLVWSLLSLCRAFITGLHLVVTLVWLYSHLLVKTPWFGCGLQGEKAGVVCRERGLSDFHFIYLLIAFCPESPEGAW